MLLKMIKILRAVPFIWLLCITASCTEKHSTIIDETPLIYNDWGGDQKFITFEQTQIVSPVVIDYFNFSEGVVFVRQVSFTNECKNGDFSTVITDDYEVYIHLYQSSHPADKIQIFSVQLLRDNKIGEDKITEILSKIEKSKNRSMSLKSGRCN